MSYSHKVENLISGGVLIRAGGLENFLKKEARGRLLGTREYFRHHNHL